MIFPIDSILTSEKLKLIVDRLNEADFVDGKLTAGWHAKVVKKNTQLKRNTIYEQDLRDIVHTALKSNALFQSAIQPKNIHSMIFSRYEKGMSYGSHVDNALMGNDFLRSDVSFTLFLSSPSSYKGGELVIESVYNESNFKLEAGSMIVYPSSTIHRVEAVTEGVRLAAVGWVQSLVRDPNEREILFDLDTSRRLIFAKEGKTAEFDLISKSYANLMRKWAE